MRAVVMRQGELLVDDVAEPVAGPGQLLVEPIATGVCGSDLSAWQHTEDFLQASRDTGYEMYIFDPDRDLVMGHEFTSRVVEVGEGVEGYGVGDVLVTMPSVIAPDGVMRVVGYASDYPGALAERVVVQAQGGHVQVPEGVSPYLAAVTEPLATGFNGVDRSGIDPAGGAIVTGCGPVGLGAVFELAHRGIHPIIASDPSPRRREIAEAFGAHVTVDPFSADPVAAWKDLAAPDQQLWVVEASGTKGILNALLYNVIPYTKITVVGSCYVDDVIRPLIGVYKNVTIEFCSGPARGRPYSVLEQVFGHIAAGRLDASRLITGYTGLEGGPAVFDLLRPHYAHAIEHMKVLVCPALPGPEIRQDPPAA